MNNLIDAYIYDVVRRLPKDSQDEVAEELRSIILDMTESGQSIEDALRELGHPKKMARQYRPKERYLISPDVFDSFIDTIKKALPIIAGISVVVSFITAPWTTLFDPNTPRIIKFVIHLFTSVIPIFFQISFVALIIITLVYTFTDEKEINQDENNWDPKSLEKAPQYRKKRISRGETIVEMIFSAIFGFGFILYIYYPFPLAYIDGQPLLNIINYTWTRAFTTAFIISTVLILLVHVVKLVFGYWNMIVAHTVCVVNIINMVITSVFLLNGSLFNHEILLFISEKTAQPIADIVQYSQYFQIGVVTFTIVISVGEIIAAYYRAFKNLEY